LKNSLHILGITHAEDDIAHAVNPDYNINYFHAAAEFEAGVVAWPLR